MHLHLQGEGEKAPQNNSPPKKKEAQCWWLRPVILATQETEIRRIMV
jgi:hypothetical protein